MRDIRTWGPRFSIYDAIILALSLGCLALWSRLGPAVMIIVMVGVHWVLFCSVFRVRWTVELAWALVLAVNLAVCLAAGIDWWGVVTIQACVTVIMLIAAMRSPYYHGVLARRVNARLDDYLNDRI